MLILLDNNAPRGLGRPVLPRRRFSRTLEGMEVHRVPEQDAALRLHQEEARFRAAVREGIAQADRGEFIEEEEMDARLEAMLRA